MSPFSALCIYLHVRTNVDGVDFQNLILKFNQLLKLTNQQHLY